MPSFVAEAYAHAPHEIGPAFAERMCQLAPPQFEQRLEEGLDDLRSVLLDEGYPVPTALQVCQSVRETVCQARNAP
jgi:hypothetical protein